MPDIFANIGDSNLFWTSLGATLGYLFSKLDFIIQRIFGTRISEFIIARKIREIKNLEDELEVETLSTASEAFAADAIEFNVTDKHFYVSFPIDRLLELKNHYKTANKNLEDFFELHNDQYLDGSASFSGIAEETGIADIPERIEKSRRRIAQQFLDAENGAYFNKSKYGVYSVKFCEREGKTEARHVNIQLFSTDYFTRKVIADVYKGLYPHAINAKDVDLELLGKYRAFMTSFGVNAIILLDGKYNEQLVLSERSTLASETSSKATLHVAMNEGLTQDDMDPNDKRVRISNCLERGLWEELGLDNDIFSQKMTAEFHDLFLVRNVFELAVSASVNVHEMTFEELYQRAQKAKDRKLEVAKLELIPFVKRRLEPLLAKRRIVPYSKYIITLMAARKGVYLSPCRIRDRRLSRFVERKVSADP
jgi:hypothetical protein